MNNLKNRNEKGELVTLPQACEDTNLGMNTVRRLAKEAGAVVKIGKSYRIIRKVLLDYIYEKYTA